MSTKSETIRARVAPPLKSGAEAVFHALGLSVTEAITLFYRQVMLHQGLPFDVKLPNRESRKALADMKQGRLRAYTSARDLMKQFD